MSGRIARDVFLRLPGGWKELDGSASSAATQLDNLGFEESARSLVAPLLNELQLAASQAETLVIGVFSHVYPLEDGNDPLVISAQIVLAVSPTGFGLGESQKWLRAMAGETRPISLPAGQGVLHVGETQLKHPAWRSGVPARTRRYVVPVPGRDKIAVLNCVTPNIDLAEKFDEVFDAIARTLEFGYNDTPQSESGSAT